MASPGSGRAHASATLQWDNLWHTGRQSGSSSSSSGSSSKSSETDNKVHDVVSIGKAAVSSSKTIAIEERQRQWRGRRRSLWRWTQTSARALCRPACLLKLGCLSLFVAICSLQCWIILAEYFAYPTLIDTYDVSPSLVTILPALTICNNNRLSLNRLALHNSTIRRELARLFPQWRPELGAPPSLAERTEFNQFRDQLDDLFKRLNFEPKQMTDRASMERLFDLRPTPESFLSWLGCARTWKETLDCARLQRIESMTNRRCVTLLHRGALLNDLLHRPHLFSSMSASDGGDDAGNELVDHVGQRDKDAPEKGRNETVAPAAGAQDAVARLATLDDFGAKELIKIVLDFEPEDYADVRRQIGARIFFHDNNFVAAAGADLDFFVTRGFRYDFMIDRRETKLLRAPYGDCFDYERENLARHRRSVQPRAPLDASTCYQNCVARNVLRLAHCWPPQIPYFRNDSLDPLRSVKPCDWFRGSQQLTIFDELTRVEEARERKRKQQAQFDDDEQTTISGYATTSATINETLERLAPQEQQGGQTTTPASMSEEAKRRQQQSAHSWQLMKTYRKVQRFCWSHCTPPCKMTEYTVSLTRSVWPTDVNMLFDETGTARRRRHCCALIAIKYTHYHYSVRERRPKLEAAKIIGDIGGLLAVWLGVSIVSLLRMVDKLASLLARHI